MRYKISNEANMIHKSMMNKVAYVARLLLHHKPVHAARYHASLQKWQNNALDVSIPMGKWSLVFANFYSGVTVLLSDSHYVISGGS
jgi:hypothetical protein